MSEKMETIRCPCDMHCHTTRSDGNDTPTELVQNAAVLGLRVIAITDHDIAPPLEIEGEDSVAFAAKLGVKLILGYEFSCDTLVDDVHLCGYGMQWDHADLQVEVDAAARSKSEAYHRLAVLLTEQGMPVDWEADVLTYTNSAGAIAHRSPDEVQRKHIFEAMANRGHAESWSEAKRIVRDNPKLNNRRRKIDPIEAIRLIHRCGGIAVLAHPYLIDESIEADDRPSTRHEYIERLIDAGLDGIESRYTYNKTSYQGGLSPEMIEQEVQTLYGERVRFLSGGSDYHADAKKLGDSKANRDRVRQLGERGLTVGEFDGISCFQDEG